MCQFDTQKNWLKNKCTKDIIIVYLKIFKFKKHHKILHTSKCRKKFKIKKKYMYLSPEYSIEKWAGPSPTPAGLKRHAWSFVAIHAPLLVLYGCTRPFWGASTCIEALFGPTEASIRVDASIWGVNSYWRPFFGRQLWSTPFWGVDASIEGRQFSAPLFLSG